MIINAAEFWWLAALCMAVAKVASTIYGLVLKRQERLFSSRFGWAIFLCSKITAVLLGFATWRYFDAVKDEANAKFFSALTLTAFGLALIITARQASRPADNVN